MSPFIDSHIHFSCHKRLEEFKEYCRRLGVEKAGLVSLPDRRRINFNPEVLTAKAHLTGICYGMAGFDYSEAFYPGLKGELDLAAQVEDYFSIGFYGLKLFIGKPVFQKQLGLRLDEPIFDRALERAENYSLPAVIHMADPPVFWCGGPGKGLKKLGWDYSKNNFPSFDELQRQAEASLARHPGFTFIFPHLLFLAHDLKRLSGFLRSYPNVYLDLSPGLYFYYELNRQYEEAGAFFTAFQDRILFGSDGLWFSENFMNLEYSTLKDNMQRADRLIQFLETKEEFENPFEPTREERKVLRGLALDPSILEKIYRKNFLSLFPEKPRPLSGDQCASYFDRFIKKLEKISGNSQDIETVQAQKLSVYSLLS